LPQTWQPNWAGLRTRAESINRTILNPPRLLYRAIVPTLREVGAIAEKKSLPHETTAGKWRLWVAMDLLEA
jgi:hypothetical protein